MLMNWTQFYIYSDWWEARTSSMQELFYFVVKFSIYTYKMLQNEDENRVARGTARLACMLIFFLGM